MRASLGLQLPVRALTVVSLSLLAAEKGISKTDLPAPVQKTADQQTKGEERSRLFQRNRKRKSGI